MIEGNTPVFRGVGAKAAPMVESYFVKLVAPDGARALWLRWTFLVPENGEARSELWAIAFARGKAPVAAKRSEPVAAGCVSESAFKIVHRDSSWNGERAMGSITAGSTEITWDFTLVPSLGPLTLYPHSWMYRSKAIPTKIVTPIPDAIAHGSFVVEGESVSVEGWRAMQGHNWGRAHTARYAWAHAAGFVDEPAAVFEGFAARPQIAGRSLPWMSMGFLYIDGAWIRFDSIRASMRAPAQVSVLRWDLELSNERHLLRGTVVADRTEVAGLHYPNPKGFVTYCFNSKLADMTLELHTPGAATRHLVTRSCALEVATPFGDRRVRMVA